jgi:hypothetical protein
MPPKTANLFAESTVQRPGEGAGEYRTRIVREAAEREASHKQELAQQISLHNTPTQRIRWWEHLHAIALPRAATHPLLQAVADQTGLSLSEIQDEQRRRLSATTAVAAI